MLLHVTYITLGLIYEGIDEGDLKVCVAYSRSVSKCVLYKNDL